MASESTDGLIASPLRREVVAVPSDNTFEVVDGPLSRYRHSEAGHNVEEEGEEVVHAPRTVGGHDDGLISQPEIPKQHPTALHPTKPPAQSRNASHKSTIPSVDHSDGLTLPTGTSMQSRVSESNRTVPLRNVTSRSYLGSGAPYTRSV